MMQTNTFHDDSQIQLRIPFDSSLQYAASQNQRQDLPNMNIKLPPQQPHTQQNAPQHMPKIKFNINGMNAELPAALSQRRNSALQSLFNTTSSLGSALNSARGNSSSNNINSARGQVEQVNLESTQELRAFATVDIAKINKDRSNQLKMALEDNLREKEREMDEVQTNYRQQREEYDKISKKYSEKNSELESEINKQKQHIVNLKEQLRQIESENKSQQVDYNQFEEQIRQAIDSTQDQINSYQKQISEKEGELQAINSQKKGLQMGIEMQRKVRIQELDMKIIPLKDERDKIQMHIDMIKENLRMLNDVKSQNENEKMMIQEDLYVSERNKIDQVFQREELEGYLEKIKMTNEDIKFITSNYQSNEIESQGWQKVINLLIEDKQKSLLLDLIRELQQYILGMSSGTTDNSVMQSDELEELEYLIEK